MLPYPSPTLKMEVLILYQPCPLTSLITDLPSLGSTNKNAVIAFPVLKVVQTFAILKFQCLSLPFVVAVIAVAVVVLVKSYPIFLLLVRVI